VTLSQTAEERVFEVSVRALRGATQLTADDPVEMADAVVELLELMLSRNRLTVDDLVSIIFTATPDLRSEFPAAAARTVGLGDVPLMCAQEIDVAGALPRVVRVMAHAETSLTRAEVSHVYLRGAEVLRKDLAQ
jgi:chorismate mutase